MRGRHRGARPGRADGHPGVLPLHMDEVGVMLLAEHAGYQLHPRHLIRAVLLLCRGLWLAVAFGLEVGAADSAWDGPRVPTKTGRSALRRWWSRVQNKGASRGEAQIW